MYNIYLYNISAKLCVYIKLNPSGVRMCDVRHINSQYATASLATTVANLPSGQWSACAFRYSSNRRSCSRAADHVASASVGEDCRRWCRIWVGECGSVWRRTARLPWCVCVCVMVLWWRLLSANREREREKHQLKKKLWQVNLFWVFVHHCAEWCVRSVRLR